VRRSRVLGPVRRPLRLAEQFTVYAIDRRGRGESGDAAAYELEREAEDVAAVVDSIDGPVVLLGHSGGALYSLEAALLTDNVRTLIVNEPPIQLGDHTLDVEDAISEMTRLLDDGENERLLVLFLQQEAHLTRDEIDVVRSAPIWQDMVDAAHTLPREYQAIAAYEFDAARFSGVVTPALVLSGGESPPFYRDATEAVDEALPNSRLVRFDGHSHEPMNTAPDRFLEEVLAFVHDSNS
jgi:pimeloyl-ACP methyl ester carboxylesterase